MRNMIWKVPTSGLTGGKTVSQRLSYHPSAHTAARALCMKLHGRL